MTADADALSDILRLVRLRACIYFVRDIAPPWGLDIPKSANGPLHMVVEGQCLLRHSGQDILLRAGDVVLLPRGTRHQVLDSPASTPEPGPVVMERVLKERLGDRLPQSTRMLCGHFEWDGDVDHPLFRELPDVLVMRDVFVTQGAERFRTIVDMITAESSGGIQGASAVADRLGEVLFVSILRAWLVRNGPASGVLATMRDARLSRALRLIHQDSAKDMPLERLARAAGMSRTSFAVSFRRAMGMPPAAYLTEWRMLQARRLLLQSPMAIADVIERVGYASEAAFVRAFKRRFGTTPGRMRRLA